MEHTNPLRFVIADRAGSELDTCYLIWDNWDDFGFKTSLRIYYTNSHAQQIDLGILHIMMKGQTEGYTPMPEGVFLKLPETHCSLGSGQGYYEELMGLDITVRENILKSLRDCVFDNGIYELNKNEEAMTTSLLRSIDVRSVTHLYSSILSGNIELTPYHFQYLLNGNEETKIDVRVKPYSHPPSNLHVLIGRNGVGKTRIISGIVDELTKNNNPHSISQNGILVFKASQGLNLNAAPNTEKFSNLVTIVFSAFDHFKPVRNNQDKESIPCQYVGLKTEDGNSFKSLENLMDDFMNSVRLCLQGQRKKRWIEAIEILNSDPIFKEYALQEVVNSEDVDSEIKKIFDFLSSGHKIILLTITKLIELVDEKTLVLIDEPENHLHPPLLSSFIRAVSDLLIKRNAVGLIATHSPVVLQETPKTCVTKIDRVRAEYSLHRPQIETYGENIDTLTRDVFTLELEDSGFYKTLNEVLQKDGATYEKLIEEFGNQIGSEGRAIARSLLSHKENKDAQP